MQAQALAEQLAMFAEKERKSEEKRQQFEKVHLRECVCVCVLGGL
jgi:hypothetical protein